MQKKCEEENGKAVAPMKALGAGYDVISEDEMCGNSLAVGNYMSKLRKVIFDLLIGLSLSAKLKAFMKST